MAAGDAPIVAHRERLPSRRHSAIVAKHVGPYRELVMPAIAVSEPRSPAGLGFVATRAAFEEDGIAHIEMRMPLAAGALGRDGR
jgi:hypothetical protein